MLPKITYCPICLGINRTENEDTLIRLDDVVFSDDLVTVFINSFFVGDNSGHVIVVPNEHIENIYAIPKPVGHRIFEVTQKMSVAIKNAYACDGITIRQNNEPAGDQHAFHFHQHVIPRYQNDNFNSVQPSEKRLADPVERAEYAKRLIAALSQL